MRAALFPLTLAAVIALAWGCAAPGPGRAAPEGQAASDTVRGTLAVVGADPLARPAVRPADGSSEIYLSGPRAEGASTFQGMEVWAKGRMDPETRELEVERLELRAVEGTVALEGTLVRDGPRWYLTLADGRRAPLRNVPQRLRELEGERVWIAAPVDVGGGSFGASP